MAACAFAGDGHDLRAAPNQVRTQLRARMVQGQRALYFLRHRASGGKAGEAHRGRAGRLLCAVPLCVARAIRNLADAPAAQSLIRTAATGIEPQADGRATGTRLAPAGESGAGISPGRAHITQYEEQKGRIGRLLEDAGGRLPLAHRDPSDCGEDQQVLQHQRSVFQRRIDGAGGRELASAGSQFMKHGHANPGEMGGIFLNLIMLLFLVIVCAVLYLVRRPILRFAAESWIIEDPLDKADAIIVLGDDNFYADRATRGAELFREGKAPVVVASGRRLRPNAGMAELMEHDLVERGVPRDKIVRFAHDADNTREEAEALTKLATQRKWHSVIVVTSNYQTRRARYIFRRVFPQGMEVRVASARNGDFDPQHWWEKRKSIKELTREFAGMVVAIWELHRRSETGETSQSVVGLGAPIPQLVV